MTKSENIARYIAIGMLAFLLGIFVSTLTAKENTTSNTDLAGTEIYKRTYYGHSYVIAEYRGYKSGGLGMVHDPDCEKCKHRR
jgi:hypothetical protein